MCGRYTLTNTGQLALRFGVAEADVEPRYNIAPSQEVPIIVAGRDGPALREARWGFRPAWLGDSANAAPINARAETLLERPLFRGAVATHRCLIPADGFYEWQARPGQKAKQPFYIRLRDGALFAFAGLYTAGKDDAEDTCALITTRPNALMAPIHDRMPAILRREDEAAWLDPELTIPEAVLGYLEPYPESLMQAYPVSTLVSNVRHEGPDLVHPLAGR
ncbi:MAG TPA: SOS response-associated peptidase [Chloroflexota bacterium]|jgi:putative SOS response-associated peptidase YedK|nr:SOS response-associated peptidase [Chloroflexota bacterium]